MVSDNSVSRDSSSLLPFLDRKRMRLLPYVCTCASVRHIPSKGNARRDEYSM